MEIVKTKIKVKVFEQEYNLAAPKAIEAAEFVDAVSPENKLKNSDMVQLTSGFLVKMGLPADVCAELELEHLQKLVEYITKKK